MTLLIEFVILGHLTNKMQDNVKTQASENSEIFMMLAQKTADQSLKRIMKISFFLGLFYFGVPFVTYIMFKGQQAIDISFAQQLAIISYSYVMLIPASLVIFAFQRFYRFKYLVLLSVWTMQLYYLYRSLYEARKKYFDF